jgi:hypothetical protein
MCIALPEASDTRRARSYLENFDEAHIVNCSSDCGEYFRRNRVGQELRPRTPVVSEAGRLRCGVHADCRPLFSAPSRPKRFALPPRLQSVMFTFRDVETIEGIR